MCLFDTLNVRGLVLKLMCSLYTLNFDMKTINY